MNWLRRIFTRPARIPRLVNLPPDFWTPEDAMALLSFRQSTSGHKVFTILETAMVKAALEATQDPVHSIHSCGNAAGIAYVVNALKGMCPEQISPAGAQSGSPEEASQQGVGADLEQYTP